jgi:hypothetical protein
MTDACHFSMSPRANALNLAYQGRPSCCRTKIVVDSEDYGR